MCCVKVWGCVGGVFKIFVGASKIWPDPLPPPPDRPKFRAFFLPRLHTTTRELQARTFQGPCASNTKIPRKDPQEREERKKIVAEEGKKARNFGPHTLRGSHPSGLHPSGLHPSGPHFSQVWAPTLRGLHPSGHHNSGPTLRRRVGLKRHWPKQVRPKQVNTFTGLNRSGLNRSGLKQVQFGLKRYWPKAVLA